MKHIRKILLIIIITEIVFPMKIQAEDGVQVLAGEAVATKENYEILAYKEMQRISNLLIVDPVQYMIEYNNIIDIYKKYLDNPITIYDLYSSVDIEYLEKCVETETLGGSFASKVNIANVIFNRAQDDERFPSTLKDVVTAPGQFAYSKNEISPLTIAACEYAAINSDTTYGALYFRSGAKKETFNGAEYLFTDDVGHHFYR